MSNSDQLRANIKLDKVSEQSIDKPGERCMAPDEEKDGPSVAKCVARFIERSIQCRNENRINENRHTTWPDFTDRCTLQVVFARRRRVILCL